MDKKLFSKLVESMGQMNAIVHGAQKPSRSFECNPISIRTIREATGLSQPGFAAVLGVEVATLRNWEQGRREPTGPAKALLRAIRNDPKNVLKALMA
jgi:putative transcriptional regulator